MCEKELVIGHVLAVRKCMNTTVSDLCSIDPQSFRPSKRTDFGGQTTKQRPESSNGIRCPARRDATRLSGHGMRREASFGKHCSAEKPWKEEAGRFRNEEGGDRVDRRDRGSVELNWNEGELRAGDAALEAL